MRKNAMKVDALAPSLLQIHFLAPEQLSSFVSKYRLLAHLRMLALNGSDTKIILFKNAMTWRKTAHSASRTRGFRLFNIAYVDFLAINQGSEIRAKFKSGSAFQDEIRSRLFWNFFKSLFLPCVKLRDVIAVSPNHDSKLTGSIAHFRATSTQL